MQAAWIRAERSSGASCVLCFGACSHPGEGFVLQISSYSAGGMPSCPAPAASPHGMGGRWSLTYHGVPGTSLATCSMPRAL